jgi:myo-inositol-1(or 4)-monophosphatase
MSPYAAHVRTATEAARSAGQLLCEAFGRTKTGQAKTNARDLVTDADIQSQECITGILKRDFPDIPILAEEGASERHSEAGEGDKAEMLWLVDPLDGTTNFTRGIELFTVAICLSVNRTPVAAVVYQPILDQLYTAEKGEGAYRNAERLAVSTVGALEGFTVSSNLSYQNREREVILENISRLMMRTAGLRLIFSVALELCLLARGSLDAALIYQANPWDMAAGCLLAREAGAKVTNWSGDDWQTNDANCLASNATEHENLLSLLYTGESV